MTGRGKKRSIVTRQRICNNQSSHTIRFMHLDDWKKKRKIPFIHQESITTEFISSYYSLACA
jgi:hypothetical protein